MTATTVLIPSSVVMRAARGSDGDALARLAAPRLQARRRAARCSSPRSTARSRPRSSVDDGTVFANPFAPTAGLIALLELRAGRAKRQKARRGLAERLRLRPAPRARAA